METVTIHSQEPLRKQPPCAIVMGASAGGLSAFRTILSYFDDTMGLPVLIVQHMSPDSDTFVIRHYGDTCRVRVKEAEDKEPLAPGCVYFAPPNYHLLVEPDHTLSLSTDARVNFSRPAIDVLFETAAEVFQERLVGVVLTGANADGAAGLAKIKRLGGMTIVQDPKTAEVDTMPRSAIGMCEPDRIVDLDDIGPLLNCLSLKGNK